MSWWKFMHVNGLFSSFFRSVVPFQWQHSDSMWPRDSGQMQGIHLVLYTPAIQGSRLLIHKEWKVAFTVSRLLQWTISSSEWGQKEAHFFSFIHCAITLCVVVDLFGGSWQHFVCDFIRFLNWMNDETWCFKN